MQPTLINRPDGSVEAVNKASLDFIPFALMPNQPNNRPSIEGHEVSELLSMSISGEGTARIVALSMDSTTGVVVDGAKIMLVSQEGNARRPLSNGSLHMSTIFGDNLRPYPMPEDLYVDELRRLVVEITNLSDDTNVVAPVGWSERASKSKADPTLQLARKRQDLQQFLTSPFWYTFDEGKVELESGETVEKTITIASDAHFWMRHISGISTGEYTLNLIDVATGESIIDAPQGTNYGLSSNLIVGTANYPFCLRQPRLFQLGQRILARLVNRSGADNTVYLTLGGQALADKMWR